MITKRGVRRGSLAGAAVVLIVLAGCGGNGGTQAPANARFAARLQDIVQPASDAFGELAELVPSVDPASPVPDAFKEQMLAVAAADRQAASEIRALTGPHDAVVLVRRLSDALEARADALERLAGRSNLTLGQIDKDDDMTEAERRLDDALGQVRAAGFLPAEDTHEEEGSQSADAVHDQIAFVRAGDIHVMHADGSDVTRLTEDGALDTDPVWSPDGATIAFVSDRGGEGDPPQQAICRMDADGTDVRRLTEYAPPPILGLEWSPDGSKIAFGLNPEGGTGPDLYVMDADGTDVHVLLDDPVFALGPTWSPDGTKIAFVSGRDGDEEIYVMNADGTNMTRLTTSPEPDVGPDWSPDGSRIAFFHGPEGEEDVYVMSVDGSELRQLTTHPGIDAAPSWAPDGTRIAFHSDRTGTTQIFVLDVDGGNAERLTDDPGPDTSPDWS